MLFFLFSFLILPLQILPSFLPKVGYSELELNINITVVPIDVSEEEVFSEEFIEVLKKLVFTVKYEEALLQEKQVYLVKNEKFYIITFVTLQDIYEKYIPIFEECVQTLKILED